MSEGRSGAISIAAGTVGSALSKWVLILLLARSQGGAGLVGQYSTLLAIATPLYVASQLGLRTIFVSSKVSWPWSTFVKLRLTGTAIAFAALIAIARREELPLKLVLAIGALKAFDSLFDLCLARLQFAYRLRFLGLLMVANAVLSVALSGMLLWLTGTGSAAVMGAAIASAAMVLVGASSALRTSYSVEVGLGSGYASILRGSLPITASQFLASLLFQVPIFYIAIVAGPDEVGAFAAAAYLLTLASLVGSTLQTVFISPLRLLRDRAGLRAVLKRSRRLVVLSLGLGVVAALPVVAIGQNVLAVLYGPEFTISRAALSLLCVAAISTVSAFISSATLNVFNRFDRIFGVMCLSCLTALLAGMLLADLPFDPVLLASGVAAIGAGTRSIGMAVMTHFVSRGAPNGGTV